MQNSFNGIMSICFNAAIVVIMIRSLYLMFGNERSAKHFRYFTTDSNILCAVSALFMLYSQFFAAGNIAWIQVFKFVGTVSVTLTMLTVLFFLAPTQGWKEMFEGSNLYMHLVNPLLAIVSILLFDGGGVMTLPQSLIGLCPTVFYGAAYSYYVLVKQRWKDFYGFNRGGRWYISVGAMLIATLLICVVLKLLKVG